MTPRFSPALFSFSDSVLMAGWRNGIIAAVMVLLLSVTSTDAVAQATRNPKPLTELEWSNVDKSVTRGLDWIANSQQRDGSFPTIPHGQPGITSLGVLAMLAQGEQPGGGRHGKQITAAIDYVISTQKPSGLLAVVGPRGKVVSHNVNHTTGQAAVYNHAISGLMLAEAYATTSSEQSLEMQKAIELALQVTLAEQRRTKRRKEDVGGWRYLDQFGVSDSDLSIMGWQIMFLRSAKNAGFDVPEQAINAGVACVKRHFNRKSKRFTYTINSSDIGRGMNGSGILALAHAGLHDTPEAKQASQAMLDQSFNNYNEPKLGGLDRYHYSVFQCTQAAYQLGDDYWAKFSPPVYRVLLANQNSNGSWAPERTSHGDERFGSVYTTSLVVLTLSAPNQLLPIYQR